MIGFNNNKKQNTLKIKILIFLIFSIVICSCKKQQKDISAYKTIVHSSHISVPLHYDTIINPYLLQNYLFNKGSYWIYKDSITEILDTCTTDSIVKSVTVAYSSTTGFWHTKYASNIRHSIFPCGYILTNNKMYLYFEEMYSPYSMVLDSVQNNGLFYLTDKVKHFINYDIDTSHYADVYKIFYISNNPALIPKIPDSGYYYFKAGIGIIKAEYYLNGQKSVYELMKYHLN